MCPPLMWVYMCRPVIWWHLQALPMQQCGWHCSSLHHIVSFLCVYFFTGSASAYGLPSSCCCFHHYCCFFFPLFFVLFLWLYLTALNCCSPGCFFFSFYFLKSVRWSCWNDVKMLTMLWSNHPDNTPPSPSFAVLTWKQRGEIFFLIKKKRYWQLIGRPMREQLEGKWNGCFEKGQSLSGKKNKQILIDVFAPPWDYKCSFLHLVILALTIIVGLIFFFSLKGSKF